MIYSGPFDGHPSNLLILLHGLGDTNHPFSTFARTLRLPQTATLALQAHVDLPFGLGKTWFRMHREGDDGDEEAIAELDDEALIGSLEAARDELLAVLGRLFALGWEPGLVFLMGFSQGAVLALEAALALGAGRLGGVVCIADTVLPARVSLGRRLRLGASAGQVPVLAVHGTRDEMVPREEAEKKARWLRENGVPQLATAFFEKEHQMISSKEETRAVLEFLAPLMTLRNIALENDPTIKEINPHPGASSKE